MPARRATSPIVIDGQSSDTPGSVAARRRRYTGDPAEPPAAGPLSLKLPVRPFRRNGAKRRTGGALASARRPTWSVTSEG